MEKIILITPFSPVPSVSELSISKLILDWDGKQIFIILRKNDALKEILYGGDQAVNLMTVLNKANLSTKSLHKRILEQLVIDGHLAGTISGTPD